MGYEQFFGLNDAPFSLAPNPRYLFESASHTAALQQLTYAMERREPLIVMTGEIGTGKTLLCRTVLQRLDRKTFVSVINNPFLERDDLLKQMLQDFAVMSSDRAAMPAASRHDMVHALEDFLSSLIVLDAHAVVIIDEAQHIRPEVLEQIRLLSNIDAPSGTMLQIILVGQLDVEALLARSDLRQFQQRVSRRIRLEPLGEGELRSYIDHRLAVGRAAGSRMPGAADLARALVEWEGAEGVDFSADAVQSIWRWSGGLPRVVNLLCDRALEAACAQRLHAVDAGLIETAAMALGLRRDLAFSPAEVVAEPDQAPLATLDDVSSAGPTPRPGTIGIAALIALIGVAAVIAWFVVRTPVRPAIGAATAPGGEPSTPGATSVAPSSERSAGVPIAAAPSSSIAAKPRESDPLAQPSPNAIRSFEIIVASFRTEARAAAAATQVSDAGLPVRRRELGGWQQVIAGPFASREAADAAHQRLEGAGVTGTRIVSVER